MTSQLDRFGKRLADVEDGLDKLSRSNNLGHSSFDGGAIEQNSEDGTPGSVFGTQFDDTNGIVTVNGPVPPTPAFTDDFAIGDPVQGVVGGLVIRWEGFYEPNRDVVAPMDFDKIEVYVGTSSSPSLLYAYLKNSIPSARGAEVLISMPVSDDGYYVWLVARSTSGRPSGFSEVIGPVFPQKIREEDLGFDLADLGGNTISRGDTAPTDPMYGDLWLQTPENTAYRWEPPGVWNDVADTRVADAIAAAFLAQLTADAKAAVFVQNSPPTGLGLADKDDLWIDSNDDNKAYTWSGTAWVARPIGNSSIKPGSLVASDVIATGTISGALLEAILVLATTIIAGDPAATHVSIRPDGLYVFAEDLSDGIPNEVIRVGTTSNDFFGITDSTGLLILALDQTGAINARTGNFREDIIVAGRPLLDGILTQIPGGGGAGTAAPGARNYIGWDTTGTAVINSVSTEVGLIEKEVTVEANRIYWVIPSLYFTASDTSTYLTVTIRDGGIAGGDPRISSPEVSQDFFSPGLDPSWTMLAERMRPVRFATSGTRRLLLTVAAGGTGTINVVETGNGQVPMIQLVDIGPDRGNGATVNRGGYTGVGTPPPVPVQQHDTGWMSPSGYWCYRGSGVQRTDTTDVVQGWDPSGFNGDGSGLWWWTLPTITGTVDAVWVWLQSNLTYYNSGGTAIIAPIKSGAVHPLSSWRVASPITYGTFPKPGSLQMNLSGWNSLFHSSQGANRAIGVEVGPSGGTDETYYIRFDGPAARMRILYSQ